jgi:hypothetical protein
MGQAGIGQGMNLPMARSNIAASAPSTMSNVQTAPMATTNNK